MIKIGLADFDLLIKTKIIVELSKVIPIDLDSLLTKSVDDLKKTYLEVFNKEFNFV
jgi:hypothetical protein